MGAQVCILPSATVRVLGRVVNRHLGVAEAVSGGGKGMQELGHTCSYVVPNWHGELLVSGLAAPLT